MAHFGLLPSSKPIVVYASLKKEDLAMDREIVNNVVKASSNMLDYFTMYWKRTDRYTQREKPD